MKHVGNLESCLALTIHHVDPGKMDLMLSFASAEELGAIIKYRFKLVESNLQPALEIVKKIRVAAEQGDIKAVFAALDEQLEFGHDFPT